MHKPALLVSSGIVAALLAAFGLPSPSIASPGGFDIIPAVEQRLDTGLPPAGARDGVPVALAGATGEVCTLSIENFELQRILTGTGHATPDEATVFGAARVLDFLVAQSADPAKISVAMVTESAAGGFDVLSSSSADLCSTWSSPVMVVGPGAGGHPVGGLLDLDLSAGGTIALLFRSGTDFEPYVVVSEHAGSTWNPTLRLYSVIPGPSSFVSGAIEVSAAGDVCVGYIGYAGSDAMLFTARSLDGGMSFGDDASVGIAARSIEGFAFVDQPAESRMLLFYSDTDSATHGGGLLNIGVSGAGVPQPWCAGWFRGLDLPLPAAPFGNPSVGKSRTGDDHVLVAQTTFDLGLTVTSTADGGFTWRAPLTLGSDNTGGHSVVRTDDGSWTVAWESVAADPELLYLTDILAATSTDDGATFSTPVKIDDTAGGTARAVLGRMATSGADAVAIPYQQFTDGGRGTDVYHELTTATAIGTAGDPRLDSDAASVSVAAEPFIAMASNASGQVFVVFTAVDQGPHPDLFFARSDDGGYTFGPPTRIGHGAPGAHVHRDPAIATDGSNVYVGFSWFDVVAGERNLSLAASNDHGDSFTSELPLGVSGWSFPYFDRSAQNVPGLEIATHSGGIVYATYSDGASIAFRASLDGGLSLAISDDDIDQTAAQALDVKMCVVGGDVLLVYQSAGQLFGMLSGNEGANWDPRVPLLPSPTYLTGLELACGPAVALATYSEFGGLFGWRAFASSAWLPSSVVPATAGANVIWTSAAFLDASTVVAAFDEADPGRGATRVYATRSTDGGMTFSPPSRLDLASARPGSTSGAPVVAVPSSGGDEVHLYWSDAGGGSLFEPVVSRSLDAGGSWEAPLRMGRGADCDGVLQTDLVRRRNIAASGSATLLSWMAFRDSTTGDVLINAYDGDDLDRDASPAAVDCADGNPATYPGAPEIVDGVDNQCPGDPGFGETDEVSATAFFSSPDTIAWPELPGATLYRIARAASATFDDDCSTGTTPDTSWNDSVLPAPGQVFYYVVQALEPLVGSFGSDSSGSPRVVSCAVE